MDTPLQSVVVPIEEGADPGWAIDHVIELYRQQPLRVHLLNVRQPLPKYVSRFIPKHDLESFHNDCGLQALKPAIDRLDACGVPHRAHVVVGQKARCIVRFAREYHCGQIVLAQPERGLLAHLGLGSIGDQIRQMIGAGEPCDLHEVCAPGGSAA